MVEGSGGTEEMLTQREINSARASGPNGDTLEDASILSKIVCGWQNIDGKAYYFYRHISSLNAQEWRVWFWERKAEMERRGIENMTAIAVVHRNGDERVWFLERERSH